MEGEQYIEKKGRIEYMGMLSSDNRGDIPTMYKSKEKLR